MRYGMIMADPPWSFDLYSDKGNQKSADAKYDCMTIEELENLPVRDIASKDCVLWLWATNPMLPQAIDLVSSWGFKYKTAGSWAKKTKEKVRKKCGCKIPGKYRWGTGYVLRSTNEPFIIATLGEPSLSNSVPSGFDGVAREHSRKPEEGYALAEKMFPAAWRMDLFSREAREGWDNYGNEGELFNGGEAAERSAAVSIVKPRACEKTLDLLGANRPL